MHAKKILKEISEVADNHITKLIVGLIEGKRKKQGP
jgi:hypothetical protein